MAQKLPKISFIGAGTVGSVIATLLFQKGYQILSIIDKNGTSALTLAKKVYCKKIGIIPQDISPLSQIIFLTVNDDEIKTVVKELTNQKKLSIKNMMFFHCSGVHSTKILEPLRKKGALTGAMHPIQTFPKYLKFSKHIKHIRGIYYGIEAQYETLRQIEKIISDLNGKPLIIPEELKPLYHTVCAFASNYMTMFLNTISEISGKLSLSVSWTEAFGPLMTASMENAINISPSHALTGPIVRGDYSTIDLHLQALSKYTPHLLPLYTIGGIEIARIARDNGKISGKDFNEIICKFRKFIKNNTIPKITRGKK